MYSALKFYVLTCGKSNRRRRTRKSRPKGQMASTSAFASETRIYIEPAGMPIQAMWGKERTRIRKIYGDDGIIGEHTPSIGRSIHLLSPTFRQGDPDIA